MGWGNCLSNDTDSTIREERNARITLMAKKAILKYRLMKLSVRSGKTEVKKKRVEGRKEAAQKTNLSLKVASNGSVVWSVKKTRDAHMQKVFAKIQNLLLMTLAGFLKSTKNPTPAYSKDIKMFTT